MWGARRERGAGGEGQETQASKKPGSSLSCRILVGRNEAQGSGVRWGTPEGHPGQGLLKALLLECLQHVRPREGEPQTQATWACTTLGPKIRQP